MIVEVVIVWCEWDVEADKEIYATEELARAYMAEALVDCGIDDPLEKLVKQGYVSFEHKTLIDSL